MLLKQKYDILTFEDVVEVPSILLNFSYSLFAGNHVLNIVLPNFPDFGIAYLTIGAKLPEVPYMSGAPRGHLLNEVMHVSKTPYDLIISSINRKSKIDDLIRLMNPKVFESFTSQRMLGRILIRMQVKIIYKSVMKVMKKRSMNKSHLGTLSNFFYRLLKFFY